MRDSGDRCGKRYRRQLEEAYDSCEYQQSRSYLAYAKDLCENYNFDRSKYRLCVKEKRFAAITRSDFVKLKEDLQFLDNALKTVLSEYQDYFQERFVEGLSIRKYAEFTSSTGQRGLPAKEVFLCSGSSAEGAGRGGGQVSPAEANAKLNQPNTERSVC